VKPAPFEYRRPETVEEAVALLGEDSKVLAGGQSLVPLMNMRMARPAVLVDVNRIGGLDWVAEDDGVVRVGALVRQAELERSPALRRLPLVAQALPFVGHHVTRNRGTVGGSIAHADASAELPLVLAALGGSVVAASPRGRREVGAGELFVTHFTTSLRADELVVETRWPAARPGEGFAFEELAPRRGDYALAMAAAVVTPEGGRVFVGSVAERPTRVETPPGEVTPELAREAAEAAWRAVDPADGLHGSSAYRRSLVRTLVERALLRAAAAARA
jgi:carbon-monoxide dehydrogenase medium subunit